MKIGLDCRNIFNMKNNEIAGVGHYVYFLIKHLLEIDKKNQYYLFFYNKIEFKEFKQPNVKFVYLPGIKSLSKIPFFYRHVFVPHILRSHRLDIYHNLSNIIPFIYLRKTVITVHDLAIYKNPKWFPDGQWFYKKIIFPLSIYKANKIIAVSENTKNDLIDIFKVHQSKIEVVHEGVEDLSNIEIKENDISDKVKIKDHYFLFVGTIEPRKNLVRIIKAYKEFLDESENKDFKLILAGKKGWKYDPIFEIINKLNLENKVIYLGYVSDKEKVYLFKNAQAFVFPSLYEGFGLPILEAMKYGTPIISSDNSSVPELVIDNALLVDPYNVESIKEAMIKITSNSELREELISKSYKIVKNFSWESCAKKTLKVYQEMTKKKIKKK